MKYFSLELIFVYKCLGGYNESFYDSILELNEETGEWSQLDKMTVAREYHAVSVIPLDNVMQYC